MRWVTLLLSITIASAHTVSVPVFAGQERPAWSHDMDKAMGTLPENAQRYLRTIVSAEDFDAKLGAAQY